MSETAASLAAAVAEEGAYFADRAIAADKGERWERHCAALASLLVCVKEMGRALEVQELSCVHVTKVGGIPVVEQGDECPACLARSALRWVAA